MHVDRRHLVVEDGPTRMPGRLGWPDILVVTHLAVEERVAVAPRQRACAVDAWTRACGTDAAVHVRAPLP